MDLLISFQFFILQMFKLRYNHSKCHKKSRKNVINLICSPEEIPSVRFDFATFGVILPNLDVISPGNFILRPNLIFYFIFKNGHHQTENEL